MTKPTVRQLTVHEVDQLIAASRSTRRQWTLQEVERLLDLADDDLPLTEIGRLMDRSAQSIQSKLKRIRANQIAASAHVRSPWTSAETDRLMSMVRADRSLEYASAHLHRSIGSLGIQVARVKIALTSAAGCTTKELIRILRSRGVDPSAKFAARVRLDDPGACTDPGHETKCDPIEPARLRSVTTPPRVFASAPAGDVVFYSGQMDL